MSCSVDRFGDLKRFKKKLNNSVVTLSATEVPAEFELLSMYECVGKMSAVLSLHAMACMTVARRIHK